MSVDQPLGGDTDGHQPLGGPFGDLGAGHPVRRGETLRYRIEKTPSARDPKGDVIETRSQALIQRDEVMYERLVPSLVQRRPEQ